MKTARDQASGRTPTAEWLAMFFRRLSREMAVVSLIALPGVILILSVGVSTSVSMGDEPYHYHYAQRLVETKTRPIFDPLVHTTDIARRYYMHPILWHAGLSIFWSLTGGVSQVTGQIYQCLFYLLLMLSTYLLARSLYGTSSGIFAVLLMATMPFSVVFSILFYTDVAVTAFSAFLFLLIFRKKAFGAGIIAGLSVLLKLNALLYIPPALLLLLACNEGGIRQRLKQGILFLIPIFLILAPEFYYRNSVFGDLFAKTYSIAPLYPPVGMKFIHPEDIIRKPYMSVFSFGVPFFISILVYFLRKKYETRDLSIWLPVFFFAACFFFLFKNVLGARYLAPILPLSVAPLSKGFSELFAGQKEVCLHHCFSRWRKKLGIFLVIISFLQMACAAGYLYKVRKMKNGIREAYSYIKSYTSPHSRFLSVNATALSLHTGRKAIWHSEASLPELGYAFWFANSSEIMDILSRWDIHYLFLEKKRIYDDSRIYLHISDYPISFIRRIADLPEFRAVFENEDAIIFEVMLPKTR